MFGFSFFATVGSVIAGGALAAATVVGVVNNTVDATTTNPGNTSSASTPEYGAR